MASKRRIDGIKRAVLNLAESMNKGKVLQTRKQLVSRLVVYKNLDGREVNEMVGHLLESGLLKEDQLREDVIITEEGKSYLKNTQEIAE